MSYWEFVWSTLGPGTEGFAVLKIGMIGVAAGIFTLLLGAFNKQWYANAADAAGKFGGVTVVAGAALAALVASFAVFGIK